MKNDTMKLLESIQNNLNKKFLKESDYLDEYTAEEYDEYDGKILATSTIFLEDDANELGISVDEVIDRLVKNSGVTLKSKGSEDMNGGIPISVLGYSDQIAKFFSGGGLYDNHPGFDSLYTLVKKTGYYDIELSKIDDQMNENDYKYTSGKNNNITEDEFISMLTPGINKVYKFTYFPNRLGFAANIFDNKGYPGDDNGFIKLGFIGFNKSSNDYNIYVNIVDNGQIIDKREKNYISIEEVIDFLDQCANEQLKYIK